jgi:hypothetical protein
VLEGAPQPQDIVLQRVRGRTRRVLAPQRLGQLVLADRLSQVQRQHREQAALLGRAKPHRPRGPDQLRRPEDPERRSTPAWRECGGFRPSPAIRTFFVRELDCRSDPVYQRSPPPVGGPVDLPHPAVPLRPVCTNAAPQSARQPLHSRFTQAPTRHDQAPTGSRNPASAITDEASPLAQPRDPKSSEESTLHQSGLKLREILLHLMRFGRFTTTRFNQIRLGAGGTPYSGWMRGQAPPLTPSAAQAILTRVVPDFRVASSTRSRTTPPTCSASSPRSYVGSSTSAATRRSPRRSIVMSLGTRTLHRVPETSVVSQRFPRRQRAGDPGRGRLAGKWLCRRGNAVVADPLLDLAKTDHFALRQVENKPRAFIRGYGRYLETGRHAWISTTSTTPWSSGAGRLRPGSWPSWQLSGLTLRRSLATTPHSRPDRPIRASRPWSARPTTATAPRLGTGKVPA